MINYSFIIPHKNIPNLLERCVNSIPQRNDIEIIIIDDNSDSTIVNFQNLSFWNNPVIKLILSNEGLGAGYVRNKGLEVAQGRWLIFADSDDYFITENLSAMMDYYLDSSEDIIFFNVECLYEDSLTPAPNAADHYQKYINDVKGEDLCRYKLRVPWGKFVKRELVISKDIKFDETKVANDRIFSLKTGIYASNVIVDKTAIYTWLVRKGSLTTIRSKEFALTHFYITVNANRILEEHSLSEYRTNLFFSLPGLWRSSVSYVEGLKLVLRNTPLKYITIDLIVSMVSFVKKFF